MTPPVNNRFTFQRRARNLFRFFSRGFGTCPNLLDTVEEQVATMFLIERDGIIIAQSGSLYLGADIDPAIQTVASQYNCRQAEQNPTSRTQLHGFPLEIAEEVTLAGCSVCCRGFVPRRWSSSRQIYGKMHDRLAPSLLFIDALKNESRAVSRQDALGIRLLAAF
jgi:hypothetical protein